MDHDKITDLETLLHVLFLIVQCYEKNIISYDEYIDDRNLVVCKILSSVNSLLSSL